MANIIQNVEFTGGKMCLYNSIRNIMNFYKLSVSEPHVFFMCEGINMVYDSKTSYIGSPITSMKNMENHSSIKVNVSYVESDKEEVFAQIFELLGQGNIIILMIKTLNLTYHEVYRQRITDFYHAILLYGVDREKGLAYVGDLDIREDTGEVHIFQGEVSLQEIIDNFYGYSWFDLKSGGNVEIGSLLACVSAGIEKYFKGGKNDEGKFFGSSAVQEYVNDLEKLMEYDNTSFERRCNKINYDIKSQSFNVTIDYLIDILQGQDTLNSSECFEIVGNLQSIRKEWIKTALLLFKIGKMGKKDRIPEVMAMGNILIERQNNEFLRIRQLIKDA